jgi:hypothetical protein
MRYLLSAALLFCFSAAQAQTYFGVLTAIPNTGPGGSCCSRTAYVDQTSAAVPSDGTCPGCSVITQTQWLAFKAAVTKPDPKCQPGSVTSDGTHINVCSQAADKFSQFPITVLGVPTTVTPP